MFSDTKVHLEEKAQKNSMLFLNLYIYKFTYIDTTLYIKLYI